MGPERDGTILKGIYAAEREADRIVRDAEGLADALRREAAARADAILSENQSRLGRCRTGRLDAAVAESDREAEALLSDARCSAEAWASAERQRIDDLADRLLAMVLPR
ncbi:MAG TPA: hypothetical protein VGK27_05320 [Candidatus Deferrimicrobiaceae bacterium]|jgi:vacuolar-type H+-ATPase subunit H